MKSVVIHPQYNKATQDNDIAIVKLKSPLTFNNNVKNACLPESSFAPQSKAVVSGWGTTINGKYVPILHTGAFTSDVFWVFLTYLPTLIRYFTT